MLAQERIPELLEALREHRDPEGLHAGGEPQDVEQLGEVLARALQVGSCPLRPERVRVHLVRLGDDEEVVLAEQVAVGGHGVSGLHELDTDEIRRLLRLRLRLAGPARADSPDEVHLVQQVV